MEIKLRVPAGALGTRAKPPEIHVGTQIPPSPQDFTPSTITLPRMNKRSKGMEGTFTEHLLNAKCAHSL